MSLDFSFTDMINRLGQTKYDRITDHPTEKGKWHPVTDALIWAAMGVGIPAITKDNAEKFYERYIALQAIKGGDILHPKGRIIITREDVENHIGMRTNVSSTTDAAFNKKLARMLFEEGGILERKQGKSAVEIVNERAKNVNDETTSAGDLE